jgi:hypothetical protein
MEAMMDAVFSLSALQAAQGAFPWWGWPLIIVVLALVILLCWWPWGKEEPESMAVRQMPVVGEPDDLKMIEGIGPKIAEVLALHGITMFAQLAETSVDTLREILDQPSLRIADPTSWPEQGRLAAMGDWEALERLQEQLKGGRLT